MTKKHRRKITRQTEKKVHAFCVEWQERLKLGHWDIASGVLTRKAGGEREGSNNFSQYRLESLVGIINPVDFPKGAFAQDIEQTVVHELLHLWFACVQPEQDTREDVDFEQAINTVAKALVQAKYDTKGKAHAQ